MKFYRIYIELTNVCGLRCSFCPTKTLPNTTMDLDFFESIIQQAKTYTHEIACHVVGDPLTLNNLNDYLEIIHRYGMKAMLTTSGYFMKKHSHETLFHPAVKQINVSLNSYNKNDTAITLEQYIEPIIALCHAKVAQQKEIFINLRMWNLDEAMSERSFNEKVFAALNRTFDVTLDLDTVNPRSKTSIRLDHKVLLHFDHYFEWPSLNNPLYGHGTCQGLDSHIAILADGTLVPCCLDSGGVIALGNLHNQRLADILDMQRTKAMRESFRIGQCSEELCLKCDYKRRFN